MYNKWFNTPGDTQYAAVSANILLQTAPPFRTLTATESLSRTYDSTEETHVN